MYVYVYIYVQYKHNKYMQKKLLLDEPAPQCSHGDALRKLPRCPEEPAERRGTFEPIRIAH